MTRPFYCPGGWSPRCVNSSVCRGSPGPHLEAEIAACFTDRTTEAQLSSHHWAKVTIACVSLVLSTWEQPYPPSHCNGPCPSLSLHPDLWVPPDLHLFSWQPGA